MSISDFFCQGEHLRNVKHFASLVSIAKIDGEINEEEAFVLKRLAEKLDITEEEFNRIMSNSSCFSNYPQNTPLGRLEKLYDLFKIIFADQKVDEKELSFLGKYAVALGFSSETSSEIIDESINLFSGQINIEDYLLIINRSTKESNTFPKKNKKQKIR